MNLIKSLCARLTNDKGQDLLEYALLVALIAVVCFVTVQQTGTEVNDIFTDIKGKLASALPGA